MLSLGLFSQKFLLGNMDHSVLYSYEIKIPFVPEGRQFSGTVAEDVDSKSRNKFKEIVKGVQFSL